MDRVRQEDAREWAEKLAESERQRTELEKRVKELESQLAQRPSAPGATPQKVGWSKRLGDWWENKVPDAIKAALTLGGAITGIGITWGGFFSIWGNLARPLRCCRRDRRCFRKSPPWIWYLGS